MNLILSSPVLPGSLFLLSVGIPGCFRPKSWDFNCVSLMPLKTVLTLKLLAGQFITKALQRVLFRLQCNFKPVQLNLNKAFKLC